MHAEMKTTGFKSLICFIVILMTSLLLGAATGAEEKEIILVVNKFFKVIEIGDMKMAGEVLLPKGVMYSVREQGREVTDRSQTFENFVKSLSKNKNKYKEVMFDPVIKIHKHIATLWAEYKFYVEEKYSHCGVDVFSLVKTKQGWKIAGIIYTVEQK